MGLAMQTVPLGSGFSGPWRTDWAGSLHENRHLGLPLSKTN